MALYFILAAVLIAAFRVRLRHDTRESTAALCFFTFCYVIPGILFRFTGHHFPPIQYYLIMGSDSFLLILLYASLDGTLPLFLAGLCEVTIILLNILGVLGLKWVPIHYVTLVTLINYVELALLIGGWASGDSISGRRIYPRIWSFDRFIGAASHRSVLADSEKA